MAESKSVNHCGEVVLMTKINAAISRLSFMCDSFKGVFGAYKAVSD